MRFGCHHLPAQTLSSKELITVWQTDDITQSLKAEETYSDLKENINKEVFDRTLKALYANLDKTYSQRLHIRILMYDILGHNRLANKKWINGVDVNDREEKLLKGLRLSHALKDQQLLSEYCMLFAEASQEDKEGENRLFYILKGIDIQRHLGFEYFKYIPLRFFTASNLFYLLENFEECAKMGTEGLTQLENPSKNYHIYFLQLDLVGASYYELGKADSARYYYDKLKEAIDHAWQSLDSNMVIHDHFNNNDFFKLWEGVADGGLARALYLQGKYRAAVPLLEKNLENSLEAGQYNDASKAENLLARIRYEYEDYSDALIRWKRAYKWALKSKYWQYHNARNAAGGIAEAYTALGQYDSAYVYNNVYHAYRDSINWKISLNKLASVNARLKHEEIANDVNKMRQDIILLNAKNKEKTYWMLFGFLILITGSGFFWIFKSRSFARKQHRLTAHFSQELLFNQEKERQYISRELHDSVGQQLTLITKRARDLQNQELMQLSQQTLEEVRTVSRGLHPPMLDKLGLTEAIRYLIYDFDEKYSIIFTAEVDRIDECFRKENSVHLYRFVQEAMTNIVKHANATEVTVELKLTSNMILVLIADNGKGFDYGDKQQQRSLGLKTMKERIRIMKGELEIETSPNKGTIIKANLPSNHE